MQHRLKLVPLLFTIVLTLIATSCSKSTPMKLAEVPVPPSARKSVLEGSYEVKIDRVISEVRNDLKEKYGKAEVEVYFLPADAGWDTINSFYEQQLSAMGLQRDASFPTDHSSHKLAVWGHDGWFSKRAVAAAFIEDDTPGGQQKFLAIFLAGD